jgi:putative NIF3 family GTP cyclohydrolase 1 type 2
MPTFPNLKRALREGCNLFVTHEPLYAVAVDDEGKPVGGSLFIDPHLRRLRDLRLSRDDVWVKKKRWLEETGMIVYRCHDFWDDFPEMGIHGAWADWLGMSGEPVEARRFYEVHEFEEMTVGELARRILERVRPLGQEAVHVIGDLEKKVSSIAIGTGAITNYQEMSTMRADVLLLTDDGTRLWESGQWAVDSDTPVIIVNHSTSEEPGMITLSRYIQKIFPEVKVIHVPTGCIYKTVK